MIMLENMHKDWRIQLCLAHYSLSLSSIFVLEYCFSHIIHMHFIVRQSKEPIMADKLLDTGKKLIDLFDKEQIFKYQLDSKTLEQRLMFFAERNLCNFNA